MFALFLKSLNQLRLLVMEYRWEWAHRRGYQLKPVEPNEFPPPDTRHWNDL